MHSAGSAALLGNTTHSLKLEQVDLRIPARPRDRALSDRLVGRLCRGAGLRAPERSRRHGRAGPFLPAGRRARRHAEHPLPRPPQRRRARRAACRASARPTPTTASWSSPRACSRCTRTRPTSRALRAVCDEYNATLLVDCAHDLGCIGEDGLGHLGLQNMLDEVDIIIGSFSKTFASNGGFIAVKTRAAAEYLKYYSATQTFSNALSPVQAAVVLAAFEIVRSDEGKERRQRLMDNILYLRSEMAQGRARGARRSVGDRAGPRRRRGPGPHRLARPGRARRHRQPRRVSGRAAGRRPLPRAGDGRPHSARTIDALVTAMLTGDARRPTWSSAPIARARARALKRARGSLRMRRRTPRCSFSRPQARRSRRPNRALRLCGSRHPRAVEPVHARFTAQAVLDLGEQARQVDRLGVEVAAAGGQALLAVRLEGAGRQRDDRDACRLRIGLDAPRRLPAVHPRRARYPSG